MAAEAGGTNQENPKMPIQEVIKIKIMQKWKDVQDRNTERACLMLPETVVCSCLSFYNHLGNNIFCPCVFK